GLLLELRERGERAALHPPAAAAHTVVARADREHEVLALEHRARLGLLIVVHGHRADALAHAGDHLLVVQPKLVDDAAQRRAAFAEALHRHAGGVVRIARRRSIGRVLLRDVGVVALEARLVEATRDRRVAEELADHVAVVPERAANAVGRSALALAPQDRRLAVGVLDLAARSA